jgi:hypothetical protein
MRAWVSGVLMLMAGCVVQEAAPPGVETVRAEAKEGVEPPVARGETQLVVRAIPAETQGLELRGAACEADSPWFKAEFASPGRVLMPDYGAEAPVVAVTCRSGKAVGTGQAQPEPAWSGGLGGWPAIGISVGTGNAAGAGIGLGWYGGGVGTAGGVPVVKYPELRVVVQ